MLSTGGIHRTWTNHVMKSSLAGVYACREWSLSGASEPLYNTFNFNMVFNTMQYIDGSQECITYIEKKDHKQIPRIKL